MISFIVAITFALSPPAPTPPPFIGPAAQGPAVQTAPDAPFIGDAQDASKWPLVWLQPGALDPGAPLIGGAQSAVDYGWWG